MTRGPQRSRFKPAEASMKRTGFKAHYPHKSDAKDELEEAIQALANYQDML